LSTLTGEEKSYMHDTLETLKKCRGRNCTLPRHNSNNQQQLDNNPLELDPVEVHAPATGGLVRGTKRKFNQIGKLVILKTSLFPNLIVIKWKFIFDYAQEDPNIHHI
jgi:hypothetical protein